MTAVALHLPNPAGRNGGFTLIEVAVALLLLTMMLTFVYQSFVMSVETKRHVEKQAEVLQAARITLVRMEREIQSAYLDVVGSPDTRGSGRQRQQQRGAQSHDERTAFVGDSGQADGYRQDRLDFTTLSHYVVSALGDDNRQSDHQEVGYFTETDFQENRTDLMYRQDFTMDDDPLGGGDIFPLIEGIKGLQFRYLDPQRGNWSDTWDSRQTESLPAAVEISLWLEHPADPEREMYFSKLVRIPLNATGPVGDFVEESDGGRQVEGRDGRPGAFENVFRARDVPNTGDPDQPRRIWIPEDR